MISTSDSGDLMSAAVAYRLITHAEQSFILMTLLLFGVGLLVFGAFVYMFTSAVTTPIYEAK